MENIKKQELYVTIPHKRVAVLIGKGGADKKNIEELSQAKLDIDSGSGEVTLIRNEADAFTFYRLEKVVKAVGRGFSPEHAKLLLESEYSLDIINITDFGINSSRAKETKRGRVIGAKGAVRKFIEDALDCFVSVEGKTVAIVGKLPEILWAKDAVISLLEGSTIPAVRKQIQNKIVKSHSQAEWE